MDTAAEDEFSAATGPSHEEQSSPSHVEEDEKHRASLTSTPDSNEVGNASADKQQQEHGQADDEHEADDVLDSIVMEAIGPISSPLGPMPSPPAAPAAAAAPSQPTLDTFTLLDDAPTAAAAVAAAAAAGAAEAGDAKAAKEGAGLPPAQDLVELENLGFAAAYIRKKAPLRIQTDAAAAAAVEQRQQQQQQQQEEGQQQQLVLVPRTARRSPLSMRGMTKGRSRLEARWGRQWAAPSAASSQQSSSQHGGGSGGASSTSHGAAPSLDEPIALSRSISAPSTAAAAAGSMHGNNGRRGGQPPRAPWRSFRRGSSSAVLAVVGSPSWEEDDEGAGQVVEGTRGRTRQDFIDEGYSEQISSSEDEYDERLQDEDDLHRRSRGDSRRRNRGGYPLTRGISDPLHGFRRQSSAAPHSPHSPLSGDSFADSFSDEDHLMTSPHSPQTPHSFDTDSPIRVTRSRSMSSSSSSVASSEDNSSIDSDTLLDLDLDEEAGMGRLARQLATPQRRSGSRSGRSNLFRGSQSRSRGRSGGRVAALEGVVEGPNEDAEDADEHARELDVEEGGGGDIIPYVASAAAAAATAAVVAAAPEIETESTVEESTPDSSPPQDEKDSFTNENENESSAQPSILPNVSSIQMSGSVEYFQYDPNVPLSPPPEADTPLASNKYRKREGRDPSVLHLPDPMVLSDRFDENNPPPGMSNIAPIGAAVAAAAPAPAKHRWQRRPRSDVPSTISRGSAADTKSTFMSMFTMITREHMDFRTLAYLSMFSILGATFRVYIGRFFGLDCEFPDMAGDVFSNAFKNICVTATGRTEQTGGALFIDLPANMIGSAMMGVMSSPISSWPNIPWLRADHPLQQHNSMHIAIRTGLCGSLTTFASWNAQMVVMLDGTGLTLGSQIIPAIFGYVLGLQASIACFLFGRKLNVWLNQWKNPDVCVELGAHGRRSRGGIGMFGGRTRRRRRRSSSHTVRHRNRLGSNGSSSRLAGVPEDIAIPGISSVPTSEEHRRMKREKRRRDREAKHADIASLRGSGRSRDHDDAIPTRIVVFPNIADAESEDLCLFFLGIIFNWRTLPFILVSTLFALYVVADVVWNLPFYRTMWLSVLFTPMGAILRWKLQLLNGRACKTRKWIPSGTIIANLIGSIVAIAAVAVETRFLGNGQSFLSVHILAAVKIGFAGSLSTVSSVVKEIVDITERYPSDGKGYTYAFASLAACCLLSLVVYSPIVRS